MPSANEPKVYDLEERTFLFAKDVREFVKTLPRSIANFEDIKQLVRSSGSVGANYIETNEALSAKDRVVRVRIARKEAKESRYWLRLVDVGTSEAVATARMSLIQEAVELTNILAAILRKLEANLGE
ncbi:Marine sediment metagenome DNA, contig: S01H1_S07457 OS=marine sediment metagenome GN=S01H1_35571 PE=4 SV=1: 23S_rRNA_IVP [Gemmata massiliana]|uniref:Four helix bundle protein n=1 Tax=Gemmata massiliana TaxID=1210884 RepID=A0A6P2CQK1_9BACT|nr:four helix bundle protein [Gemmata massiliana]VTR91129.1 Marine sediment metagenome DNA, contig: S01H1_S07457 OS=marine sediment metagenome GN=S01H1_35571 PE=4 SV=1: 23S_rRNA_IVP [Gemmata massiliana]